MTASGDSPFPELKKTHTIARTGRPYTDYKPPAAAPVWAAIEGYGRFHVLVSALELGAFEALAWHDSASADELAAELDVSAPHLTSLLEGVVALGFLEHHHGRFSLNDTARRYLLVDGPASMVDLVPVSPGPLANWHHLTETVRTGAPPDPIDDDPVSFYRPLVAGTFTTIFRCATRADLKLRYSALDAPRVLDLGAGAAPGLCAILTANPAATAVVNDLDGVLDLAEGRLSDHQVADRAELRPGDYLEIDVEADTYDIVVLGHILRAESEERARALVELAAYALKPGGRVLIGDYFADRQRALEPHALMMGVTMMASTRHGRVFRYADVAAWMRDAGFEALRLIEPIGFQMVAIGTLAPPASTAAPAANDPGGPTP